MFYKEILKAFYAKYANKLRIYNFITMQRLVNKIFSFTVKIPLCIERKQKYL